MKAILFAALAADLIGWVAFAADPPATNAPAPVAAAPAAAPAQPAPAPAAPAAPPKQESLTPEEQAQYALLVRGEVQLNAQLKLLNELIDQHVQLVDSSPTVGSLEKSQWEGQLVQDLRNRSAVVLAQLNDLTKQRLAFEAAHGPRPASPPPLGALDEAKPLNADEFAYVTRLDELMLSVRQQIAGLDEEAKGLYTELQTNNAPEEMTRVSVLLDDNARRAKLWEREESQLELRKLEFRALRKQ